MASKDKQDVWNGDYRDNVPSFDEATIADNNDEFDDEAVLIKSFLKHSREEVARRSDPRILEEKHKREEEERARKEEREHVERVAGVFGGQGDAKLNSAIEEGVKLRRKHPERIRNSTDRPEENYEFVSERLKTRGHF